MDYQTDYKNVLPTKYYPNIKKELLKNTIAIFGIILLLFSAVYFVKLQTGINVLTEILSSFDITPSVYLLIFPFSIIIIILILNYITLTNEGYIIFDDKIEVRKKENLFIISTETIPFENITRIFFSNEGILDKMLNCGKITIEISGMKKPNITLESIDAPEQVIATIQQKINNYNLQKQIKFQEQEKIKGILKNL
ncbi:MAG: hypothetical protein QXK76_03720 [Candidatus Woesearchaeota archaeon]